jgi:uncharacterized protein
MPVAVTAIYTSVLALLILALAINVTRHRAKLKVGLGDGGNPQMLRMIRLHANAVEYAPIGLLLMGVYRTKFDLAHS